MFVWRGGSHVLTAIGLIPAEARASLRFSVGRANTREEIDKALELFLQRLRVSATLGRSERWLQYDHR